MYLHLVIMYLNYHAPSNCDRIIQLENVAQIIIDCVARFSLLFATPHVDHWESMQTIK